MRREFRPSRIALLLTVVIFVLLLGVAIFLEHAQNGMPVDDYHGKTLIRNGVAYYPRQDITVLLVMGIDQKGPAVDSGSYNNAGDADAVMLIIFDETEESYRILTLNRDTMVQMPVLGLGGKQAGTRFAQLTLSHTYGNGLEDSCENTKTTVSDLLYGLRIDYYVSMRMDAIGLLNDAVDGVTVEVVDDFSAIDSSIPMGQVTLNASQALTYLQTRKGLSDQLNITRMKRHEAYMQGFVQALQRKLEMGDHFATDAYHLVEPYVVTDCHTNVLASMVNRFQEYTFQDILTPEGENVRGETYMEFYLDEEKLDQLIIELFYEPK